MLRIDFWYQNALKDADSADVSFYPQDGEYRGNFYNNGRPIGDFCGNDSVEIGKTFPGIFGDR